MVRGWKKLTKAEKQHVTFDAGCRNTSAWLRNIEYQVKHEILGHMFCLECKLIAKKLGDWPKEEKTEKEPE